MCRFTFLLALASALFALPLGAADIDKLKPWSGGTPKLVLKDLEGTQQDLKQYRGKVVLVNFWATWCGPCIKEMPSLQRLAQKLASERFTLLMVNFGEGEDKVKPFLEKMDTRFTVLLDRDMNTTRKWVDKGLPTTYIIDAQQKIRYRALGDLEWDTPEIEARVRSLFPRN